MSEREKEIIREITSAMPKLKRENQKYVLGIVEGLAMAREEKCAEAQEANDLRE